MGFSLFLSKIESGQVEVTIDRQKLAAFLKRKQLMISPSGQVTEESGQALAFEGQPCDLYMEPLNSSKPLSARLYHANLSDDECAFLFELCVEVGWLLVNPQGTPLYLVPNHNHIEADLPDCDEEDLVFIDNAKDMQRALSGGYGGFQSLLEKIGGNHE